MCRKTPHRIARFSEAKDYWKAEIAFHHAIAKQSKCTHLLAVAKKRISEAEKWLLAIEYASKHDWPPSEAKAYVGLPSGAASL